MNTHLVRFTLAIVSAVNLFGANYGAIEIGSKGVKSSLFHFEQSADGPQARQLFSKTINTTLMGTMKDKQFSPAGMDDAATSVKQALDALRREAARLKLTEVQYFLVASSGVATARNVNDLAALVQQTTGLEVDMVNARQESQFAMISSVPVTQRGRSILVDIGSGNTKIGCQISADQYRSAELEYGSVSLRKHVETAPDYAAGLSEAAEKELKPSYDQQANNTPCLLSRARIYWVGGAAWAAASIMHPEAALAGYVYLSRRDIDTLIARLKTGGNQIPAMNAIHFAADVTASRQNQIRAEAAKEYAKVGDTFSNKDLQAGLTVLRSVLSFSRPDAPVVFSRNGNWLYGYTLGRFVDSGTKSSSCPCAKENTVAAN